VGYILKINGVTMPTPKHNGVTYSENKVWSTNTGRNMNGDMVGTIVAIKKKVEIEFPVLTPSEVELINTHVSSKNNPFVPIEITSPMGDTKRFTCYFGDLAYPIYGLIKGKYCVNGFKLSGIEQ
jgi:hypothetical protein